MWGRKWGCGGEWGCGGDGVWGGVLEGFPWVGYGGGGGVLEGVLEGGGGSWGWLFWGGGFWGGGVMGLWGSGGVPGPDGRALS